MSKAARIRQQNKRHRAYRIETPWYLRAMRFEGATLARNGAMPYQVLAPQVGRGERFLLQGNIPRVADQRVRQALAEREARERLARERAETLANANATVESTPDESTP